MSHPNRIDLEALACGDDVPHVATHLSGCEACRAYVERARAAAQEPVPDWPRARRPAYWPVVARIGLPITMAAAGLLFYIGRGRPLPSDPTVLATASIAPSALDTAEPTRFKGGIQLAVIRDRNGVQQRFTTSVRVRPGDRLRLEVALDAPREIVAGVMSDRGAFLEIMPNGERGPGTHHSERSARVDDEPTNGYAIVGTRERVEAAQMHGDTRELVAIPILWEGADSSDARSRVGGP